MVCALSYSYSYRSCRSPCSCRLSNSIFSPPTSLSSINLPCPIGLNVAPLHSLSGMQTNWPHLMNTPITILYHRLSSISLSMSNWIAIISSYSSSVRLVTRSLRPVQYGRILALDVMRYIRGIHIDNHPLYRQSHYTPTVLPGNWGCHPCQFIVRPTVAYVDGRSCPIFPFGN